MRWARVVAGLLLGGVLGAVVAGAWWTWRDRRTTCLGGCSDKDLPAGDLVLAGGALVGLVAAALLLALLSRRARRGQVPLHRPAA